MSIDEIRKSKEIKPPLFEGVQKVNSSLRLSASAVLSFFDTFYRGYAESQRLLDVLFEGWFGKESLCIY